jgi:hypothetical protein
MTGTGVTGSQRLGVAGRTDPLPPECVDTRTLQILPWQSELLSSVPGVVHGLTRRVEGLGRAHGNIGFSAPRDRDDAWAMRQRWCTTLDLVPEHLVTLGQIHGRDVRIATKADAGQGARPGSTQIGLGDALVTNQIGPVLMTLHADCQPVLIIDPGTGRRGPAIGVAHAGWRGTVADIAGATLAVMTAAFGSRSSHWSLLLRRRRRRRRCLAPDCRSRRGRAPCDGRSALLVLSDGGQHTALEPGRCACRQHGGERHLYQMRRRPLVFPPRPGCANRALWRDDLDSRRVIG